MSIRADSYSSEAEVTAFTKHLLDGQPSFNSTTRPTITELDTFIDRASGVLNVALASKGFMPASVAINTTAKLACADWVTMHAVAYVELTQRGTGFGPESGSRTGGFEGLYGDAELFIEINKLGFQRIGVLQSQPLSAGLTFTGLTDQADRTDKSDTSLEQPFFSRRQFDFPKSTEGGGIGNSDEGQGDQ